MPELQKIVENQGDCFELAGMDGQLEHVHVFDRNSIEAIDAALLARRPLLIRGEPGTGKSQLARAAAKALGRAFIPFIVDSRTEPRELLWEFDAVGRLAEAQLQSVAGSNEKTLKEALNPKRYVRPGPLWWAFHHADARAQAKLSGGAEPEQVDGGSWDSGAVLLVDEIDKAESDVPNALLGALGTGCFVPTHYGRAVHAQGSPLVIVTTNEERSLPDAFVRRCLVLQLSLPDKPAPFAELLVKRGQAHFPQADEGILKEAAERVWEDRTSVRGRSCPSGQAEYMDLIRAIVAGGGSIDEQREALNVVGQFVLGKHRGER